MATKACRKAEISRKSSNQRAPLRPLSPSQADYDKIAQFFEVSSRNRKSADKGTVISASIATTSLESETANLCNLKMR